MADSRTNKKHIEEYGVRTVKGRWSEWSLDGNGITCETKEQTSGLTTEDLAWLLEPHLASYAPEEPWVPVGERLPATTDPVLVHVDGDMPAIGFYRNYDKPLHWAAGWYGRNGHVLASVTHWRPLPPEPGERAAKEKA